MRLGRRCAQLALAGLVWLSPMAQGWFWLLLNQAASLAGLVWLSPMAQAQAPQTLVVKDGQSASEIALDEVAPGTTIDQFLLALYQLNPQAFVAGDLNRLLAQAKLVLPTAEQANQVPLAQAREALARIRGGAVPSASPALEPAPPSAPSSPAPEPVAAVPSPPAQDAASAPSAPLPSPAVPTDSQPTWLGWLLVPVALMALYLLTRKRRGPAAAPSAGPTPDAEDQAQGRFQPVLPGEPRPNVPAPPKATPKPALFDLDLNLDGKAPPLDLPKPAGLGKLPDLNLDLPSPTPRASASGPLDLSGLSLDLDSPAAPKDKP